MRTALVLALSLSAATAQQVVVAGNHRHDAIRTLTDGLVLPAGDFTVAELIDAVARYLCRNYLYDPNVVETTPGFTLQRPIALDAPGSEEVLYALLAARGLAALALDEPRGIYQVVSLEPGANAAGTIAAIPWRRPQDLLLRPHLRELVLTAVPLQHLDAARVAHALHDHFVLQRTWQPGAPVVTCVGGNTLVLHGYGDHLAQTIRALHEIDRLAAPPPPAPGPTVDTTALLRRLEALEAEVAALRRQLAERR